MARLPRLTVAGYPHHVIQRGNNRQPIFQAVEDYQFFLDLLAECAQREKVAVHSYVLMTNHVHLLATPQSADGLPRMMQAVGRRYVQHFNRKYTRTGALWEGRYRATLVQSDRYLLACMVYIDLNPVRAGMVVRPADYRWSSYTHYAGLRHDKLLTPHALYWGLGNTPFAREAAYIDLVNHGLALPVQKELTDSLIKGWALGDEKFLGEVNKRTTRRLSRGRPGRPFRKPV